ncbi:MAG: serine hydrolase domain-containing protein [Trueperaceae bacterium]|nr:serine hydrolase domain-containing protein [Trueperaceae bacterium]
MLVTLLGGGHAQGDVAGTWQGRIELPGSPLEVEVTLQMQDGAWGGSIDIPAQGARDLPLAEVRVDGPEVHFGIEGVQGDPTFDGTHTEGRIEGTFVQGGQEAPFTLSRAEGEGEGEEGDRDDAQAGSGAQPPGPSGQDAGDAERVEDPDGRFSVPVPTNWEARTEDGRVVLSDPEGTLRVDTLAIEGATVEEAIAEAWTRVDPAFDREPVRTDEPPARGGYERIVQHTYSEPGDERSALAVGRLHQDTVYVQLVEGPTAAMQRRSSQVNIAVSGLEVHAIQEETLSPDQVRALDEERLQQLEAYVEEVRERFDVPGATVSVVQDGRTVYARGFGTTGPEGREVRASTRMMIGSTTKTLTTMMMGVLVDRGELSWDTPVVDVLPNFAVADPEITRSLTVENLVCACTGVPRRDYELFFQGEGLDAEGVIASLADFEFFTEVGEAFQYSNQMVAVGGYAAAAAAAGAAQGDLYGGYVRAMRRHVLEPMGLAASTFSFDRVRDEQQHAMPHALDASMVYRPIPLEDEAFVTPVAPAGALWSNAVDMGRYLITLLNRGVAPDGRRVVSEEALDRLWTPQVSISSDTSYGLGWIIGEYDGLRLATHGGNTLGFTSDLALLPGAGLGVSVLANAGNANAFTQAVRTRVFELAFDQAQDFDQEATFMRDSLRRSFEDIFGDLEERVEAATVADFTGRYREPSLGEIELRHEEGRLILDAGEFRTRLLHDPEEEVPTFMTGDTPLLGVQVQLREGEEGTPRVVLGQGATTYGFEPVP